MMGLKHLIRWAMAEQIRRLKEEVAMSAIKELGLEDELAYEVHKANEGVMIQCASCNKPVDHRECYELYVGMGGTDYICKKCQKLPFITVMKNTLEAEPYIGFPPKTLDQLLAEKEAGTG